MSPNLEYEILELALDEFSLITAFVVADQRLHISRQEMLDAIKILEAHGLLEIYVTKNVNLQKNSKISISHLTQQDIEGSFVDLSLCQSEKTRQRLAEIYTIKNRKL